MKISVLFAFAAALAAVPSTARGYYYSTGFTYGGQPGSNYVAQNFTHDWMSFNLAGLTGSVTAATIVADSPSNVGNGIFTLYDVTTDPSTLGQYSLAAYQDLGSGTVYGAVSYAPYNPYLAANLPPISVSIPLNSDALSAINAGLGGHFAVGGATSETSGFIFGYSNVGNKASLVLQFADDVPVPEPATIALLGWALGIGARRKRRSVPLFEI